jgi:hypothetical protein
VYFLQTNLDGKDGLTVWTIYNILKEVESSFRSMKTDLNLRPVFHKKDMPCLAYLHLGILAYWVVATIRYQLKQKGYTKGWTQIVDIMDTQHSVATEMKNLQGDTIHIESPTEPTEQVREICEKVGISPIPYKMRKSVGVQFLGQKMKAQKIKWLKNLISAIRVKCCDKSLMVNIRNQLRRIIHQDHEVLFRLFFEIEFKPHT